LGETGTGFLPRHQCLPDGVFDAAPIDQMIGKMPVDWSLT
jgi:hypothetical protein